MLILTHFECFWLFFHQISCANRYFMDFSCNFHKNHPKMHSCIKEKPWKTLEKPRFSEGFRKSYFFTMFLHISFRDACFSPKNASKIMISEATWLPCGVKVGPRRPMEGHGGHPGADFNLLAEAMATLQGYLAATCTSRGDIWGFWSSQDSFRMYFPLGCKENPKEYVGFSRSFQDPTFSNVLFTWSFGDLAFE